MGEGRCARNFVGFKWVSAWVKPGLVHRWGQEFKLLLFHAATSDSGFF